LSTFLFDLSTFYVPFFCWSRPTFDLFDFASLGQGHWDSCGPSTRLTGATLPPVSQVMQQAVITASLSSDSLKADDLPWLPHQ
jgi:hypothetical protein